MPKDVLNGLDVAHRSSAVGNTHENLIFL